MIKSFTCLLCLIAMCSYITINKLNGKEIVYTVNGKSSGEFIADDITLDKLFMIDGVSMKIDTKHDIEDKLNLLNAKKVHYFTDGEVENYYFYSNKIHNFEIISGKKVNIHLAIKKDSVVVGCPIIYYGY